ncbi:MAG: mechanosensitive ion channel family protein [Geminicoccaceae bacterium]
MDLALNLEYELIWRLAGDRTWLGWALIFVILACGLASRLLGDPPPARRYPRLFLIVDALTMPLMVLVIGALLVLALQGKAVPIAIARVNLIVIASLYLVITWLIARAIDLFFWRGYFEQVTKHSSPGLLRGLTYAVLIILGGTLFLWQIGYPVTGVLVSTGVIAAALGFALQNTLADLFAGIAISVERPFQIGDWIQLDDGKLGEVVDIGWRSTRLLSFFNTLYVVPNTKLALGTFENLDEPNRIYAPWYMIKVTPEIDPQLVVMLLKEAVSRSRLVMKDPPPVVRLADATGAPYEYMVWVNYPTYMASFRGKESLFREIDRAFREAGLAVSPAMQEMAVSRRPPWDVRPPTIGHSLRNLELFSVLNDDQIAQIASACIYRNIDVGTVLMTEGEGASSIYIVVVGLVELTVTGRNRKSVVVERLTPGQAFGQLAAMTGEPAIVTATAVAESVVLEVGSDAIKPLVDQQPTLAEAFAAKVAGRIKTVNQARAEHSLRQSGFTMTVNEIKNRITRLFG